MDKQLHVHFMGICGSGAASIALLSVKSGFKVTGCDQNTDSYYAGELKKEGVEIFKGHDESHLKDVDIVAVSPALFDVNPDNPELLRAKELGILMTWQQFMGEYLQKGKKVIAVSGTHGKTTTTFLASEMLIEGEKDPTALGGSVYNKWGTGGRFGKSELFICEADEFNRNFYHYKPETAVLNNVEMDHPECFKDFEDVLSAFVHFVTAPKTVKTMIINGDSAGTLEVLKRTEKDPVISEAQVYLIFKDTVKPVESAHKNLHFVTYHVTEKGEYGSRFELTMDGETTTFHTVLTGEYNVSNAATAAVIARTKGVCDEAIANTLENFVGAGRRFDKVGMLRNVPVYDDYAHHPTEISSVLTMCREYFPAKKILAVFEPHQISRLTLMFDGYVNALTIAHHVVIWKTHIGREIHSGVTPIAAERWENASPRIRYEEDAEEIVKYANELIDKGECDLIVVIGAASSYLVSRRLVKEGE